MIIIGLLFSSPGTGRTTLAIGTAGAGMVADAYGDSKSKVTNSMTSHSATGGYFKDGKDGKEGYMHNKLSGKS